MINWDLKIKNLTKNYQKDLEELQACKKKEADALIHMQSVLENYKQDYFSELDELYQVLKSSQLLWITAPSTETIRKYSFIRISKNHQNGHWEMVFNASGIGTIFHYDFETTQVGFNIGERWEDDVPGTVSYYEGILKQLPSPQSILTFNINYQNQKTKEDLSRFAELFITTNGISAIRNTEDAGHWAWGAKYFSFIYKGRTYMYEEYNDGAYSNVPTRRLTLFDCNGVHIDPSEVGLLTTRNGEYIEGGAIDLELLDNFMNRKENNSYEN